MPHGGHDDADVEGVCTQLDDLISERKRTNRFCILVGDWNAVVGSWEVGDDDTVGIHGIGTRSGRGEWLVQWASAHRFVIANTTIEKFFDDQWTHQNDNNKRQLDYLLMNAGRASWIEDAGADNDIGIGSDHRTIKILLKIPPPPKIQSKPDAYQKYAWLETIRYQRIP